MVTLAQASPSPNAMARPSPRPPPLMMTTLPFVESCMFPPDRTEFDAGVAGNSGDAGRPFGESYRRGLLPRQEERRQPEELAGGAQEGDDE